MRTNLLYRLLVSSYAISTFSEGIIIPVYAIFVQKIGGDILDAGIALGLFLITQGIFTMLVHRFKWTPNQRIALLVGGWFVWLVGIGLYLAVSNTLMLFITQILTAMGNAVADPIVEEEIATHADKGAEEFEWGFFEGSNDLMSGLAAILGGAIISFYSFQTLIYFMITAGTISFLLILYYVSQLRRKHVRMQAIQ